MQNGSVVSILVAGAVILASVDGAAQPAPADPAPKPAAPAKPAPKPAPAPKPPVDPADAEDAEAAPAEDEPAEAEAEGAEGAAGETRLPEAAPQAAPSPFGPMQMWPQGGAQQETRSSETSAAAGAKRASADDQIFAEDWWSHTRPALELHGYFRVRAELFHNFSLGRIDPPEQQIWPMPADNYYRGGLLAGTTSSGPQLCTTDESGQPGEGNGVPCKNKTQAGANIRFRLNPELHISDNLRVISQVDLLDNLVLGSTPGGYANEPDGSAAGWSVRRRSGYTPLGALDDTQEPPSAGINNLRDSIRVKRAWAEYMTPVGELRFGRMPDHWGLGMMINSGDGYDDDYQSTVDRIQFVTSIKPLDLYLSGAWDFVNEGVTSDSLALPQAQPYDLAQLDDVDQYTIMIARKKSEELTKLSLARGGLVLNGGVRVTYRKQHLANDQAGSCADEAAALDCGPISNTESFRRRGASAWMPDLWLQLRYKKFRFEAEAAAIRGSIENVGTGDASTESELDIEQYGVATEIEQRLVEDRLKLQFKFGWASGDGDVGGTAAGESDTGSTQGLTPGFEGLQRQFGDDTMSTFRFHPSYRVDLILNRNILTRVQGVYYFRPSVDYDFMRSPNGQRFGGSFAAIWTRASQFTQAPGHKRDLGVELNLSLYFQSKDGGLNDDLDKMGGFYTMLQYGVLFPLGGMGYPSERQTRLDNDFGGDIDTSAAQVLRWYLGVMF